MHIKHNSKTILGTAFLLLVLFTGCKKSTPADEMQAVTNFDPAKATLIKQGSFTGNMGYTVSGAAKLYDFEGKKYIYLESFNTSSGPDLKLYIATTATASQFISLGALKSNSGAQAYLINNPPDFNQYNKILIWCQQFSVLFGQSTIQ